jgi:hypothetical protein
MPYQAHCGARSCGAPITWTTSTTGSNFPVDTEPNPKGNVAVRQTPTGLVSRVVTKDRPAEDGEVLHMPHHATCHKAELYRRQRGNAASTVVRDKPLDGLW